MNDWLKKIKIIFSITLQFYFRLSSFANGRGWVKLIITAMFIKDETHRNYIVPWTNRLKLTKIMFHAFSQSTNGEEKNSQIESTNICYV